MAIVAACQEKIRHLNYSQFVNPSPWFIPGIAGWEKLTDGELGGFLVCIDAVNNLQRLALPASCDNITGSGLTPLNGSTVLQQIDCTFLDANIVIPILHSILDKSEMSLVYVQWKTHRMKVEKSEMVNQFMKRFEKCLNENEKVLSCFSCKGICKGGKKDSMVHLTCYQCLNHCCIECKYRYRPNAENQSSVILCNYCEMAYCSDCEDMNVCQACNVSVCLKCREGNRDLMNCW